MKALLATTAAVTLAATLAANAQPVPPPPASGPTCIQTYNIDHTKAPDDRTILFYMRDGSVLQTNTRNVCSGLSINGFAYVSNPAPQFCPGLQTIRVLRIGGVCMLTPFVPYVAPPKPVN
jgi:hypothetical protein